MSTSPKNHTKHTFQLSLDPYISHEWKVTMLFIEIREATRLELRPYRDTDPHPSKILTAAGAKRVDILQTPDKTEFTIYLESEDKNEPDNEFTAMKAAIAADVSKLYPITPEQLIEHADHLPAMEAEDTRIAMNMLGILAEREGRSIREHSLAIKLGIARTGSATELAKACRIAASADTTVKKAVAIDHLFGTRHIRSGTTLITPDFPILPTDH